jgi:hypothetical protein
VAPKAAKWALVGPVLTACGGQEGGLSEFSDSLYTSFGEYTEYTEPPRSPVPIHAGGVALFSY